MAWNVGNGHNTKRIQVAEMKFLKYVEAVGLLDWEWNEVQKRKRLNSFSSKWEPSPLSGVLLEKHIAAELVWEFIAFYGIRRIINILGCLRLDYFLIKFN
jgi:hypothetical protein